MYVYTCMYIYIYVSIYAYMYMFIHVHMYVSRIRLGFLDNSDSKCVYFKVGNLQVPGPGPRSPLCMAPISVRKYVQYKVGNRLVE